MELEAQFNYNFVINGALEDISDPGKASPEGENLRPVAELRDEISGQKLMVKSTQPGIQGTLRIGSPKMATMLLYPA